MGFAESDPPRLSPLGYCRFCTRYWPLLGGADWTTIYQVADFSRVPIFQLNPARVVLRAGSACRAHVQCRNGMYFPNGHPPALGCIGISHATVLCGTVVIVISDQLTENL